MASTTVKLISEHDLAGQTLDWAMDLLRASTAGSVTWTSDNAGGDADWTIVLRQGARGHQGFGYSVAGTELSVTATDEVGAAYGLIGVMDEIALDGDLDGALTRLHGEAAATSMAVRGIMRSFSSVHEDLPWFTSREFWTEYLDWMAQSRFSRFHLALGMQYNYGADRHGATDNYLCFAYPFLLDVPGWDVRAEGVDRVEQARNLEMLRFIAAETKRRGMDFQLGLWNHAYDYGRDSEHSYPIVGLTEETHAQYCADAIAELVRLCPDIDGFSFRVHYEGGIHDTDHELFWEPVFEALSQSGQGFQVDMHAKGVDDALLDAASKPGLHPVLGAKYWAEHQGLPYHQAQIRQMERARPVPPGHEMRAVTEFARRFTRYGYADFLGTDRRADMIFRVWPGTQKLLLWGDPEHAAGYGRLSTFAGSLGVDLCEPLFFKGRKGSGLPGRRDPYIAPELQLGLRDWTKYKYTYRVWGRKLFNPDAQPREWQGYLRQEYGSHADTVERTLAPLSRILPLVTVAHGLGGSNNGNWPEVYTNLPVTEGAYASHHGGDTEAPPMWGTVSPFDPKMFYIINEWAAGVVEGKLDGRYTPLEVAEWIEGWVGSASSGVEELLRLPNATPQQRRTAIDAAILARLGRFFAAKSRSAADYAIYQRSGDHRYLQSALEHNKRALTAWVEIVDIGDGIYQSNLRFGEGRSELGGWSDRRPAIQADVEAMENELRAHPQDAPAFRSNVPDRPHAAGVTHPAPTDFSPGSDVVVVVDAEHDVESVVLNYRHVNQAEDWQEVQMDRTDTGLRATIPASYTSSTYGLMYFFTITKRHGATTMHPGLQGALANQPYYMIMPATP